MMQKHKPGKSRREVSALGLGFNLAAALALVIGCAVKSFGADAGPKHYEPNWESLDQRPVPAWFLDAKFGIFIHWGLYSVPSWGEPGTYAEWYWNHIADRRPDNPWWQFHAKNYGTNFDYSSFTNQFRAELFDPNQWADILARSGAKYIAITSKHHDGFCLWPSEEASRDWSRPWNSVDAGPRRDLLADIKKAVEARGVKFGIYYSLYEWYNPLWQTNKPEYIAKHMFPQFKDVVTRYAPAVIFSDGEWDLPSEEWKSPELLAWLFNESVAKDYIVIDDRWGKETRGHHGGYYTTEMGAGLKDDTHPWEENHAMGCSYGYNRRENLDDYRSGRELVLMLVDLVSRGGNLLLDIGPNADGQIPVVMQDRLVDIGDWLKVNGEAIYGTRYAGRDCQWSEGKRPDQDYGQYMVKYNLMQQIGQKPKDGMAVKQAFFTQKPDALYAIIPGWPADPMTLRKISVPANPQVTMLGVSRPLDCEVQGDNLIIHPPKLNPEETPCRYAYVFKIPGGKLLPQ